MHNAFAISYSSANPCSVELGWSVASGGASAGTVTSSLVTILSNIFRTTILRLRKSEKASVHLMIPSVFKIFVTSTLSEIKLLSAFYFSAEFLITESQQVLIAVIYLPTVSIYPNCDLQTTMVITPKMEKKQR